MKNEPYEYRDEEWDSDLNMRIYDWLEDVWQDYGYELEDMESAPYRFRINSGHVMFKIRGSRQRPDGFLSVNRDGSIHASISMIGFEGDQDFPARKPRKTADGRTIV